MNQGEGFRLEGDKSGRQNALMPGLSGIEVAKLLREDPDTADIPVIMLTARGQEKDREKGQALGAYAYLLKPFSPLQLLEKVKDALR